MQSPDLGITERLPPVLCELTGLAARTFRVKHRGTGLILEFAAWGKRFVFRLVVAFEGTVPSVSHGIHEVRGQSEDGILPLVITPYMGQRARELCQDRGVGWVDLSGNAHVLAPHLCLVATGRENRYRTRRRSPDAFAPKSSRIARVLLGDPGRTFSQRELAEQSGITDALVSRVVGRLLDTGLLARDGERKIRVARRGDLIEAWREVYDFSRHRIIEGHLPPLRDPNVDREGWGKVPASSGEYLLRVLARKLSAARIPHRATGLAAAWLYDRFAAFRTITVYLTGESVRGLGLSLAVEKVLRRLGWQEGPGAANLWLVVPADEGVVHGKVPQTDDPSDDWIARVTPLQVYLDLKSHPERSEEAAQHLKTRWFEGKNDD